MLDDRARNGPVRPSERATAQREIDVFVVEEESLVEAARLAQERRIERHGATVEDLQVDRGTVRRKRFTVTDVGPGAVAIDLHAEAGDEPVVGSDERRLRGADIGGPERIDERREPPGLHDDIVVQEHDHVGIAGDLGTAVGGGAVAPILHSVDVDVRADVVCDRCGSTRVDHHESVDATLGQKRSQTPIEHLGRR